MNKIMLSAGVLFSNMFIASAIAANEEPLPLKIKETLPEKGHRPLPFQGECDVQFTPSEGENGTYTCYCFTSFVGK